MFLLVTEATDDMKWGLTVWILTKERKNVYITSCRLRSGFAIKLLMFVNCWVTKSLVSSNLRLGPKLFQRRKWASAKHAASLLLSSLQSKEMIPDKQKLWTSSDPPALTFLQTRCWHPSLQNPVQSSQRRKQKWEATLRVTWSLTVMFTSCADFRL